MFAILWLVIHVFYISRFDWGAISRLDSQVYMPYLPKAVTRGFFFQVTSVLVTPRLFMVSSWGASGRPNGPLGKGFVNRTRN